MAFEKKMEETSKFLSFVLRHRPEAIGLELNYNGWVTIDDLVSKANASGMISLTHTVVEEVVESNDKKRFSISEDGRRVRANQGHSLKVDLELKAAVPPVILFHGTATRFLDSILSKGLTSMQRNHVHLSSDANTALSIGKRHGKPVVLQISAGQMSHQGYKFHVSTNKVWLVKAVPPAFLSVISNP